jgi:hypothetical protein
VLTKDQFSWFLPAQEPKLVIIPKLVFVFRLLKRLFLWEVLQWVDVGLDPCSEYPDRAVDYYFSNPVGLDIGCPPNRGQARWISGVHQMGVRSIQGDISNALGEVNSELLRGDTSPLA